MRFISKQEIIHCVLLFPSRCGIYRKEFVPLGMGRVTPNDITIFIINYGYKYLSLFTVKYRYVKYASDNRGERKSFFSLHNRLERHQLFLKISVL